MEAWVQLVIEQFGYFGVFFLIAVENLFPPIPSEIILTFSGFLTTRTALSVLGTVFYATLGSVTGGVLLYCLGFTMGRKRIQGLMIRHGRLLRVRAGDIDRAIGWFERYQGKTVFFCRMIPLVRSLISIPAGIAGMPMRSFLLLTAVGSLIWNTVLVAAGAALGEAWESVAAWMNLYSTGVYLFLGIAAVVVGGVFLLQRRKRR